MLKFLVLLPSVAAVPTCLKQGTLGKDPFLPAPSMYVGSWTSCAAECQKSLICKEFTFKEDTMPSKGGCWLFNKVDVDFQEDPKAVTGDKSCGADPGAGAEPEAAEPVAAVAATAPAVEASLPAATLPAVVTVAPLPALSASADAAVDAAADAVETGLSTPQGKQKAMVATGGGAGGDHTVLYCVLGGSAAAGLIALGGYFMMPGAKKKRKRGGKPKEPEMSADLIAEEAPVSAAGSGAGLDMGQNLEMQAPTGYLPLPQGGFVPSQFQYSQGQYMAYQPGSFQTYQPMTYQPVVYQQPMGPMAMEPTTYMPSTTAA